MKGAAFNGIILNFSIIEIQKIVFRNQMAKGSF